MRYTTTRLYASVAALGVVLPAPAFADVPGVVADLPVTHSLVSMVMGDLGSPVLLLDRGADPHEFALRPSQARALAGADLVVWMGGDIAPWMTRALDSLASGASLELLAVPGLHLQPFAEQRLTGAAAELAHEHDHGQSHGHNHGHDHGHNHGHAQQGHNHGHDHGHNHGHAQGHSDGHAHADDHDDVDPHAWLDLDNALVWLSALAVELSSRDPSNAAAYAANAAAASARLTALEAELAQALTPARDAGLVMYHDAYGYLAHAFGLNVLGSIALGDAAAPGAARLSAIRASLEQSGAVCIFPEVNHPDAFVGLVQQGSGLRVGPALDPEGVMLEPGADLYETLMRDLARDILACVSAG